MVGRQVVNLRWRYFGLLSSYVDCSLIAMSLGAVLLAQSLATGDQLERKLTTLDRRYQDFYTPARARHTFDLAIAGVVFLACVKVFIYLFICRMLRTKFTANFTMKQAGQTGGCAALLSAIDLN